jgi:HD-GYP domain-containing protein (c-di-GMP phosphodiesterase class II)
MNEYSNISQIIFALSDALDLVGIDDINHGKRVAFMALEIAKLLNFKHEDIITLFHASLLHDCGVSSSRIHNNLVVNFDWEGAKDHCITGYKMLNSLDYFKDIAPLILFHHTHWDTLKEFEHDKPILEMSNLIFLADRIDITLGGFLSNNKNISKLSGKGFVQNKFKEFKSSYFKPEFVEAFFEASEKESFWFNLEELDLRSAVISSINYYYQKIPFESPKLELEGLKEISKLFACFVDAKSPYTADHSLGVAALSKFIGEKLGLDNDLISKIEVAALLHDLGKLKIPDEILEKKGSLTEEEFNVIKYHSFETNKILSNIRGIEDITLWASQHHEKLNGKGYPYHYSGSEIPLPSRIIAVSDIFQALAQKRPYRDQLKGEQIMAILKEKVNLNEIDKDIVALIQENLSECWKVSLSKGLCA